MNFADLHLDPSDIRFDLFSLTYDLVRCVLHTLRLRLSPCSHVLLLDLLSLQVFELSYFFLDDRTCLLKIRIECFRVLNSALVS